ncbi:MAG: winged helix-turn-helix transcriptional regulator [Chloroflexi bacterium]|jgi:DeoR family suf operon transcriptional repressor|nr:winged helix-turn-helix transcriptional regulator [Chloroflexota bacterium]
MKSTRDRILQTLLYRPNSSINELAEAVGINAISVRHHLTNLQADGLVVAAEERHGVGRPRLVYYLTEKGLERFPSRYLTLTNRLLEQLKESFSETTVNKLFIQMAKDLAANYAQRVSSLPMEKKLDFVKEVMVEEGFSLEWEKNGNQYEIHEITCPYYHIGQQHPEVCAVDQTILSTILDIPTEKIHCVLNGDKHCTYVIPSESDPVEKGS